MQTLALPNFLRPRPKQIEIPLKAKRIAKKAYLIPKGYITKFAGRFYLATEDQIIKPNNRFHYYTFEKASIFRSIVILLTPSILSLLAKTQLFVKWAEEKINSKKALDENLEVGESN